MVRLWVTFGHLCVYISRPMLMARVVAERRRVISVDNVPQKEVLLFAPNPPPLAGPVWHRRRPVLIPTRPKRI